MRLRKLRNNILLLLLTIVIMAIFIEAGFRLFYKETIYTKNFNDPHEDDGRYYIDSNTGLVRSRMDNSIYLDIYRLGGSMHNISDEQNLTKILIVGDSFTVGASVSDPADAYPSQLYRLLNGDEKLSYQVLPFGMAGINTYQESLLLNEILKEQKPQFIILQYCNNDIDNTRSPMYIDQEKGLYVYSKSRLIVLDGRVVPTLPFFSLKTNEFLLGHSTFLRFLSYTISMRALGQEDGKKLSFDSVLEMKRKADSINSTFIMIYTPLTFNNSDPCHEELANDLRQLCAKNDITCLSMCDYANINAIRTTDDPSIPGHYSKEGYRIAAEILKRQILNLTSD
jgi:lysophospholipase L1-like esterase